MLILLVGCIFSMPLILSFPKFGKKKPEILQGTDEIYFQGSADNFKEFKEAISGQLNLVKKYRTWLSINLDDKNLGSLKQKDLKEIFALFKKYDLTKRVINIKLQNNNLTELPENLFTEFVNLESIDLSNNKLTTLPETIFPSTTIRTLDLSNNQLNSLPVKLFENTPVLYLVLKNNTLDDSTMQTIKQASPYTMILTD